MVVKDVYQISWTYREEARPIVCGKSRAWYQTCNDVSTVMGDALHDQSIIDKDIGYMVDGVDRLLFQLRFYIPESLGTLRRRNPELAKRFDKTS